MEMASKDPIESAAKGATEGSLEWTEGFVKQLARRFKDRKIAFVQNPETIEVAKEQRNSSEWGLFRIYVDDERLHILFQMGLTLRRVEKNKPQCDHLRGRIVKKYGAEGLHIAQFVQNGLFGKYIANILDKGLTIEQIECEIKHLFENIEITNSYIQSTDNVEKKATEITTKILSHCPNTYIISGSKSATKKCRQVKDTVMRRITGYTAELYRTEIKEIYFLNRLEK
jgi:hypothetical protein